MDIIGQKIKSKYTGAISEIKGISKGKLLIDCGNSSEILMPVDAFIIPQDILDEINNQIHPKKKSNVNKIGDKNIAIKCIFCDGGKNEEIIGFNGLCSDKNLIYNIENNMSQCSDPDYDCYKYFKKVIDHRNLENCCYECRMLNEWKAYAGIYKKGKKKGQPMSFKDVAPRSVCVLTTRLPNQPEENRIIFGLFYINESDEGNFQKEGYVKGDPKYCFSFSLKEASNFKFWDFYSNKTSDEKWNTGLHRYLSNEQIVNIIKRAIEIKQDEVIKNKLKEFLDLFIKIKSEGK